jgi:hypothetical protein
MSHVLVVTSNSALGSNENGSTKRIQTITSLLRECGFTYTLVSDRVSLHFKSLEAKAIIVHSFANVRKIPRSLRHKVIWIDCMDSWRLNRKSLVLSGDFNSLGKFVIDSIVMNMMRNTPIVSYISKRDLDAQIAWNSKQKSIFQLHNDLPETPIIFNENPTSRLVFVGDFSYPPNKFAVRWLARQQEFKRFRSEISLYGTNYKNVPLSGLVYKGYQPKSEIYSKNNVHLVPIKHFSGVMNKVVEPLIYGNQVVVFSENFKNGDLLDFPNLHRAKNDADFCAIANSLLIQDSQAQPVPESFLEYSSRCRVEIGNALRAESLNLRTQRM